MINQFRNLIQNKITKAILNHTFHIHTKTLHRWSTLKLITDQTLVGIFIQQLQCFNLKHTLQWYPTAKVINHKKNESNKMTDKMWMVNEDNTIQKLFLFYSLFNILKSNNQSLEAYHYEELLLS